MKNENQKRQGDVLVERISELTDKEQKDCRPSILAHGEATGHAHTVERGAVLDANASLLEVVEAVAFLQHQEHGTIELGRGRYEVTRQQSYQRGEIKRVED